MITPSLLITMMNRHGEVVEYSRTFETDLRRDGDYSTFLLRRSS
jgi:hypothetical protein